MTDSRHGQVVTFYSFKGGTGRTMALANVAWILAANGHRVLVVDWDLESPGLHRFYRPFLSESLLASTGGVIDLIRGYEAAAKNSDDPGSLPHAQFARVQLHAFSLNRSWPGDATLDFLSAGRHNHNYARSISGLNWDDFYEVHGGGLFLDALRADMKRNYDFTLIDSRTGWSDVADICTMHMPDTLVACFTLSDQGIDGAARVAKAISRRTAQRSIRVLPVPTRIDPAEKAKSDIGLSVAKQRFRGLPSHLDEDEREAYWTRMRVPYQSFYAYEELLATFGDEPGAPGSVLSAFETLATAVADGREHRMPPLDRRDREQVLVQFTRLAAVQEREITLHYDLDGAVWAEWVSALLRGSGVQVHDPGPDGRPEGLARTGRPLIIHTSPGPHHRAPEPPRSARTALRVYVADVRSSAGSATGETSAWVAGADPLTAADRILRLVGSPAPTSDVMDGMPRFPGLEPAVRQLPPRNPQFIGRLAELDRLREGLRSGRAMTSRGTLPIVVHGLGGIGKTQLALEYAYRFRSAYDAVVWIDADPNADVEQALSDLGADMGLPMPISTSDGARAALSALSRGEPYPRWLLIFDNAEDPARLSQLLPSGPGDVIITTRDEAAWAERSRLVPVGGFTRKESVAYLRARVATLTDDEADRLSALLDDLPIAVALAAAWLSETGAPVTDYLDAVEKGDLGELSSEEGRQRVDATWGLSLERLAQRSAAAYRLLELCSMMAPEISLQLVYSDAMAHLLVGYDPTLSDPLMLGKLVSHLKRLALLQIDQQIQRSGPAGGSTRIQLGHIVVHRLVQYAVRARMSQEEVDTAKRQVHQMLASAAIPLGDIDAQSQWPQFQLLWPHLDPSDATTSTVAAVQQLIVDRVRYHVLRSNPDRGLQIADEVEAAWKPMLASATGRQHADLQRQLLRLRFNRANILRDKGMFAEALELDLEVLEAQRQSLSDSHPHTLMTAGSLAADLRSLGRYEEALQRDEQTYAAWRDFDEEHPLRLSAQSNLAVSHRLMGHLAEALKLDEEVFHAREKVLGPNHLSTLLSATSLGRDLREMGEYERSIALLSDVRDRYTRVLPDSRLVLNAQANLAISLRTAGRSAEAADLLDQAYARLLSLVGADHTDTLACRLSRSVNLLVRESEDAEAEIRAVLDGYQRWLGPDHPHTLACGNNLAAALRHWGDLDPADRQARAVTESMDRVLGPQHPYALAARMNLAIVAAEQDHYDEALNLMASAASQMSQVLGPSHPHTLRCEANLAVIRRLHGGEAYQAEEDAAIDRIARRVGTAHPAVAALRHGRLLRRIIDPHPF